MQAATNIMNQAESRIDALDGLRGLCILVVLVHNLFPYDVHLPSLLDAPFRTLALTGWIGVQWFFVLSGFLITGILFKLKNQSHPWITFYARRTLRIFPLYYLVLILFILVLPLLGYYTERTQSLTEHQWWYWLYANNWMPLFSVHGQGLPHLWSLAVEEQFYLVWPWLIFLLPVRVVIGICSAFIISAVLFRYYFVVNFPNEMEELAYQLTIDRWDALALGALLAIFFQNKSMFEWLQKHFAKISAISVLLFLISFVLSRGFAPVGAGHVLVNQSIAALLGVVLVYESMSDIGATRGHLKKIFQLAWLRQWGKYSYAIYIFHLMVSFLASPLFEFVKQSISLSPVALAYSYFIFCILFSYLLAVASWYCFEAPILGLKKYFPTTAISTKK